MSSRSVIRNLLIGGAAAAALASGQSLDPLAAMDLTTAEAVPTTCTATQMSSIYQGCLSQCEPTPANAIIDCTDVQTRFQIVKCAALTEQCDNQPVSNVVRQAQVNRLNEVCTNANAFRMADVTLVFASAADVANSIAAQEQVEQLTLTAQGLDNTTAMPLPSRGKRSMYENTASVADAFMPGRPGSSRQGGGGLYGNDAPAATPIMPGVDQGVFSTLPSELDGFMGPPPMRPQRPLKKRDNSNATGHDDEIVFGNDMLVNGPKYDVVGKPPMMGNGFDLNLGGGYPSFPNKPSSDLFGIAITSSNGPNYSRDNGDNLDNDNDAYYAISTVYQDGFGVGSGSGKGNGSGKGITSGNGNGSGKGNGSDNGSDNGDDYGNGNGVGIGIGNGVGKGNGNGNGVEYGNGNNAEYGTENGKGDSYNVNIGLGSGTGKENGKGVGVQTGSSYGYGSGAGSGSGIGIGTGSGVGNGTGSSTGYGSGYGSGSGTGFGIGITTGSGSSTGYGSGSGTGSSSSTSYGSGSSTGSGSGVGTGVGIGIGSGKGIGSGVGTGSGVGVGIGSGIGIGSGTGTGVGTGVGTGLGSGVGAGVGLGVGSGVDSYQISTTARGAGKAAGDGQSWGADNTWAAATETERKSSGKGDGKGKPGVKEYTWKGKGTSGTSPTTTTATSSFTGLGNGTGAKSYNTTKFHTTNSTSSKPNAVAKLAAPALSAALVVALTAFFSF